MATKAQIARQMYGTSLDDLTPGEKAAVTRAFNAQQTSERAPQRRSRKRPQRTAVPGGYATVRFGRPSINGTRECICPVGTTMGDALEQSGMTINPDKEGVLMKDTGAVVLYKDPVVDGAIYIIVPGVDSSA